MKLTYYTLEINVLVLLNCDLFQQLLCQTSIHLLF